jgi:hypothetical protein
MITTPGHGTFPMGHGTQAYAVAYVLKKLLNLDPQQHPVHKWVIDQLDRQTARIATNRVIAGVHFPVDSMAGRMLGVALGEYFYGRCTGDQTFMNRKFLANGVGIDNAPTTDFNPFKTTPPSPAAETQELDKAPFHSASPGANVTQSDLMEYVWLKARLEWDGRFGVP